MDHRGAQTRPVAAIAVIDMLDHLFAALMFKIDINIGWLIARFRNETLKHHRADFGADRSDTQTIAHHRIGRRSAPLTQDTAVASELYNIVDSQEIRLVFQLGDQGQFMRQHAAHLVSAAVRITPFQPSLRQTRQPLCRGFIATNLRRVFIAQRVERERHLLTKRIGALQRCRMILVKSAHFGGAAQALFAIGQRSAAQRINPNAQTDCGQNIGQFAPPAVMHQRRGAGKRRQTKPGGQTGDGGKTCRILTIITRCHHQMHPWAKAARQTLHWAQPLFGSAQRSQRRRWMQQQLHPLGPSGDQIFKT